MGMSKAKISDSAPRRLVQGYSPKDIETRVVKNFLDILILVEIKKHGNLSGYDITAFVNERFGGVLSPGTVYATVYSMERKGLIEGMSDGRKTVYKLTDDGEDVMSLMIKSLNQQMISFTQKFAGI